MKSLTPKKVALAIGVSESSMKRWCDRGLIETTRTAGGHRRLIKSSVIQFLRDNEHRLIDPQVIGLPEKISAGEMSNGDSAALMFDYLSQSDSNSAKALVVELYVSGKSLGEIFDEVIASAFRKIGEKWECGELEVYHERRGCEICISILQALKELLPAPAENAPIAIGGAPENDAYAVPSAMVELALMEKGWRTYRLGSHIPFASFRSASVEYKPKLIWLSVSHIADEAVFLQQYNDFVQELSPETWVVVGGNALTEEIRSSMTFSAYCDNIKQLEAFAARAIPRVEARVGESATQI